MNGFFLLILFSLIIFLIWPEKPSIKWFFKLTITVFLVLAAYLINQILKL